MTSKNSFWKHSFLNLKKRVPFFVLCFLVCFFCMPVYLFFYMSSRMTYMVQLQPDASYLDSLRHDIIYNASFGPLHMLLTVVMAMVLAISAMAWNNSVKKVDFYKSLPVKASARFLYIHLNSLLIYMVCMGGNLLLAILVVAAKGVYAPIFVTASLHNFLLCTLLFLGLYFIACCAQALTGNALMAELGTGILWFAEFIYRMAFFLMGEIFYNTWYNKRYDSLVDVFKACASSPLSGWFRGYKGIADKSMDFMLPQNYGDFWQPVLLLFVQALVWGVIAYVLYQKRPNHAVSGNMVFPETKPFIKCLIMIPGVVFATLFVISIGDGISMNGRIVFGLVSGLIIFQMLLQVAMEGHFKDVARGIPTFLVTLLVCGFLFLFYKNDLSGFDTYLPEAEKVESVGIIFGNEFNCDVIDINGYRIHSEEFLDMLSVTDRAAIEDCLNAIRRCMDNGTYTYQMKTWGDKVVLTHYVDVRFTLKDGRQVYRSYVLPKETVDQIYLAFYDLPEYRKATNELDNGVFYTMAQGTLNTLEITFEDFVLSDLHRIGIEDVGEKQRLLDAAREDHNARTSAVVEAEKPIGQLKLTRRGGAPQGEDGMWSMFVDQSISIPVYASDSRVMAILQEKGFEQTCIDPKSIASLTINAVGVPERYIGTEDAEKWANGYSLTLDESSLLFDDVVNAIYLRDADYEIIYQEYNRNEDYEISIVTKNGLSRNAYFYDDRLTDELEECFLQ